MKPKKANAFERLTIAAKLKMKSPVKKAPSSRKKP